MNELKKGDKVYVSDIDSNSCMNNNSQFTFIAMHKDKYIVAGKDDCVWTYAYATKVLEIKVIP